MLSSSYYAGSQNAPKWQWSKVGKVILAFPTDTSHETTALSQSVLCTSCAYGRGSGLAGPTLSTRWVSLPPLAKKNVGVSLRS